MSNSKALVPNPNAFKVEVGQTVHCNVSGRPIVVASVYYSGNIYEAIEPTHPAYQRLKLRWIGTAYREFEPMFIPASSL